MHTDVVLLSHIKLVCGNCRKFLPFMKYDVTGYLNSVTLQFQVTAFEDFSIRHTSCL